MTADVEGTADALFAVLVDPRRHTEIDGSGTVQAAHDARPITGTGQVFTMTMTYPSLGEYRTDNLVVDYSHGRSIAWMTSRTGLPPAGVRWSWTLTPIDAARVRVEHGYDWSRVVDPEILARVAFPRVSPQAMQQTVERLRAAGSAPR